MNAQQALEYSMQPFIPMFIYGDYDAMESERQRGEEAMKALLAAGTRILDAALHPHVHLRRL